MSGLVEEVTDIVFAAGPMSAFELLRMLTDDGEDERSVQKAIQSALNRGLIEIGPMLHHRIPTTNQNSRSEG